MKKSPLFDSVFISDETKAKARKVIADAKKLAEDIRKVQESIPFHVPYRIIKNP